MLLVQKESATFSLKTIVVWLELCCRRGGGIRENVAELGERLQNLQPKLRCLCSTRCQERMLFWTAAFIRLQVILSFHRVMFRNSVDVQPPVAQKNWRFGCSSEVCVLVANRTHSQGQSAALCLRTCRMCKTFRNEWAGGREGGGEEKKKNLTARTLFLFFPPEGVSRSCAVGAWGTAGDSGWKGVFQLDAFHQCFGKRWWKPGEVQLPRSSPRGPCGVRANKEREAERVGCSTECLQSPRRWPQRKQASLRVLAAALPLQVRSETRRHRSGVWRRNADKGKRGHEKWKAVKPHFD